VCTDHRGSGISADFFSSLSNLRGLPLVNYAIAMCIARMLLSTNR